MTEMRFTDVPAGGAGAEVVIRPLAEVAPMLDAELVSDHRSRREQVVHAWVVSRRVPMALKPATQVPDAPQARRELLVRVVKATTVRAPLAVGRGVVVWSRAWHRWVQVSEWRESAREEGKYSDKAKDIRDTSRLRWKVSGGVLAGVLIAALLVLWLAPTVVQVTDSGQSKLPVGGHLPPR